MQTPQIAVPIPPTPPAVPVPAVVGVQQSLDVLQIQAAQLQAQAKALEGQRRVMSEQMRHRGTQVQAVIAPALAQVDARMAETQARLAEVRAELAAHQGGPRTIVVGGPFGGFGGSPRNGFDPDLAAGLMFAFIFAVLMPISIAIAKRIWRGRTVPVTPRVDEIAPRLDRLEQAVDAIAIEIERVAEGQRFVTKVMAERLPPNLPPANGVASSASMS